MRKVNLIQGMLFCFFVTVMSVAPASRMTIFINNSDYDIKVWLMECMIDHEDKQLCFAENYGGYLGAHQSMKFSHDKKIDKNFVWKKAGTHISAAVIQTSLSSFDPKALINYFPICNDIHNDNVNGSLILDVDPNTNKITCVNKIIS